MDENEYLNSENEEGYGGKHSADDNSFNDDFIIGKGFEFQTDTGYSEPDSGKAEKKPRKWIGTVILLLILAFCIGVAITVSLFVFDFLGIGFGRDGKPVQMDVEMGASTDEIANKLKDGGVIEFPMFFKLYSKFKGYDGQYKYGLYVFNNDYGYSKTAKVLIEDGKVAENVTVRIPEGANVDKIAELLEEKGVCTRKDFIHSLQYDDFDYDFVKKIDENDVYYRLEGYLYPDTYNFYSYDSGECAHLAIDKMLSNLNKNLDKSLKKDINNSGYSLHKILTMASIVELESGSHPEESQKVAAVFFNRLKNSKDFPTLGSSPTIKYPYGNGRYNTYTTKGLPPGPLCSMSINSIRASANPQKDFDYYYFVTDKEMNFYYNKTLAQHNSTISKLKAKGQWLYEYIE